MQVKVNTPTGGDAPAEGVVPADDNGPIDDMAFEDNVPAEGGAPTEDIAPAVGNALIASHQEKDKLLHGDVPGTDAKFMACLDPFLSLRDLNTSMPYMLSHQKLLFLSSTIVALMAIVVQLALEMEVPNSSSRSTRPGWARHRDEGWGYHRGG